MAEDSLDFSIIHEDEDILVADKPAGLLAVPIPNSEVKNLFDLIVDYCGKDGAGIETVHRIDRYTSGLMVFARNEQSCRYLFRQFKDHTPVRSYLALVRGIVEEDEGELTHYLKLIKEGFRNIVAEPDEEGAALARLTYRVKERFLTSTLVEAELDTGLKNQIRVQFEAIGHQLVGDQHYAPEEKEEPLINRQALHASRLSFRHPSTRKQVTYAVQPPADMIRLIDYYRWKKEMPGI